MTTYNVFINDTFKQEVYYSDYLNSKYILNVAIRGAVNIDTTAIANNVTGGFTVIIPTSTLTAGNYSGFYYITYSYSDADSKRIVLEEFSLTVKPDFLATSTGTIQTISFARQALSVVESQILACGTNGYLSISTDGKTISRITISELMGKRNELLQEIELEDMDDRTKRGQQTRKPTFISFR